VLEHLSISTARSECEWKPQEATEILEGDNSSPLGKFRLRLRSCFLTSWIDKYEGMDHNVYSHKGVNMKIRLSEIRLDGGTQPRANMDQEVVGEYADYLMDGVKMPGLTVFHDGTYYWLADGFHRYFAHKKADIKEAECEVRQGSLRDAVLYSVGANDNHGLRRSNEDKRKAVITLLEDIEWSDWADREIARQCRVSVMTVGRIKKSLNIEKKEKKFERNGKQSVMKTENIGVVPPPGLDNPMQELAVAHSELAEENAKLMDMLAVRQMDATPEEKVKAQETLESLRAEIKTLEAELHAVKISRDQLQSKTLEMQKQINYWRKKAEKVAA